MHKIEMQLNDFWENVHLASVACLETHVLIGSTLHTLYLLCLFGAVRCS